MKRQALWFTAGVLAGVVVAREVSRRKRWGSEFRPRRTPLSTYRQLVNEALCRLYVDEPLDVTGGYVTYGGQRRRIVDHDIASGVMSVEP